MVGGGQGGPFARGEGDDAAVAEAEGAARAHEQVAEEHRRRMTFGGTKVGGDQVVTGRGEEGDVEADAGEQVVDVVVVPAVAVRRP